MKQWNNELHIERMGLREYDKCENVYDIEFSLYGFQFEFRQQFGTQIFNVNIKIHANRFLLIYKGNDNRIDRHDTPTI